MARHRPTRRAQNYFGQNQVQYDRFKWQILETEHFLIYFYPRKRAAIVDAARMAERAYARLSRVLDHQFREKKPIMLFSSRTDFGQNNVTGDLGEGTGGVTEATRHRMLLNFTGDYRSFEHVLTHEMVHAFQYDIFARGKAGNGLQTLAQYLPPLWFAEGMAEYLSLGPSSDDHDRVDARRGAQSASIPTIEQLSERSRQVLPVSLRPFAVDVHRPEVGRRGDWADHELGAERRRRTRVPARARRVARGPGRRMARGHADAAPAGGRRDGSAAQIRAAAPHREAERRRDLPRARRCRRDGKTIAFLANGSLLRGQVFIDLWLGDAETGKRTARLIRSHVRPEFRGAAAPLLAERVLARRTDSSRSRRSGAARTCCTCSTCDRGSSHEAVRPRAGVGHRAQLVARRNADRVQRQHRRHHGPVSSSTLTARASGG